jgi:hypothetical protein
MIMNNTCESKETCRVKMLQKIKGSIPQIIGLIIGAAGGLVYYYRFDCATGTCPITSNPCLSVLWGTILGYLIGGFFKHKVNKTEKQ